MTKTKRAFRCSGWLAGVLLVVAWVWLGVHLVRLPDAVWRGAPATTRAGTGQGR